ncbi:TetR/AcrR family transcriptional regulator [Agromyces sp. LHK192]|uniref:TetR/AcrR family transcriptional regulator n=1 Tax=Agromyces sp. LHK192 TaxID=2498704 RepID=UPI0013E33F39|nr:TetR/AcrR family transcriptional regulator [Agromyces sp. LHK192]
MRLDPRQIRTRELLAEALTRLLERKTLDEVTVAELCREAAVHRTTFYGHFDSVAEFALQEFSQSIDRIAEVDVDPRAERPVDVSRRYVDSMRDILTLVADERAGYRTLLGSSTRGVFRIALEERLRERARLALEVWRDQDVPGAPRTDDAMDRAAAFIAGALVGIIETWSSSDETDAATAAEEVGSLLPGWWPRA